MLKEREKQTRDVTPWRPFSGLSRVEREMERFFEDVFPRPLSILSWPERLGFRGLRFREPAVEIYEEKDDIVVKAEIPGMKKEDLELDISGRLLTIKGERKQEEEVKKKGYYYSERSFGAFARSLEIPKDVQADKVKAAFKDGVLEIRLPKTEETKKKEVKIRVE